MSKCKHAKIKEMSYLEWYTDAQKRYAKGEDQKRCPVCKLWIWASDYFKEGEKR